MEQRVEEPGSAALADVDRAVRRLTHRRLTGLPTAALCEEVCETALAALAPWGVSDTCLGVIPSRTPQSYRIAGGAGPWGSGCAGEEVALHGLIAERVVAEGVAVEEPELLRGHPHRRALAVAGARSARIVPLILDAPVPDGRRIVGVLAVFRPLRGAFPEAARSTLETVAGLATLHLVRCELAEADAVAAEQRRVAFEVARDLASLEPPVVISRLLERLIEAVDADRGTVSWVEGDDFVTVHSHDPEGIPVPPGSRLDWRAQPDCCEAIIGRHPVLTGEVTLAPLAAADRLPYQGVRHRLLIPIVVGDRVVALVALSRRRDLPFHDDDVALAAPLINVAAVTLHNARLYEGSVLAHSLAVEAAERAAELERAKSLLLRVASHELRAPISVARGYVSMLADGSLPAAGEARDVVAIVERKLDEINRLVDDMLVAARLEDGRLGLDLGAHDLRDLLRDAVAATRPQAGPLHSLVVDVPAAPIPVDADARRIATVLTNLIGNALKYSPDGGEVRCSAAVEDERAVVRVSDPGLGIPAAAMGALFTRFGRIVTDANSHIPGVGLGLHLARELSRLHGGELTIASLQGEGTTATLTLPLRRG